MRSLSPGNQPTRLSALLYCRLKKQNKKREPFSASLPYTSPCTNMQSYGTCLYTKMLVVWRSERQIFLCAVVVSDGFSGREHMWTYIKSDDGRWFRSLDQSVTEVWDLFHFLKRKKKQIGRSQVFNGCLFFSPQIAREKPFLSLPSSAKRFRMPNLNPACFCNNKPLNKKNLERGTPEEKLMVVKKKRKEKETDVSSFFQ
ncbi:hypothetical protein VP01_479g2 [Puccinia sorghi]|uniref:Uncharacterized protein n=1 Tax=Puccinia sorghi TaxID=27349 RepID=A0A0L6UND1_9BASI|nr:hypothetical protein VP01_479g2 [Puccinia sorghi]